MKIYDLRINRPKQGDQFFKKLHLGKYSNDMCISLKKRGPSKTRWLRALGPHLQQFICRVACDRAKGEKRCGKMSLTSLAVVSALESVGIKKTWVDCSSLIQLRHIFC